MRRENRSDHLMGSITDLVTSLMVIFILFLVATLTNKSKQQALVVRDLMTELKAEFRSGGFGDENIKRDAKDPSLLLFIVPEKVMNFASNESALKPEGAAFIKSRIPQLAAALYEVRFRPYVEAIIVEGHTDRVRPRNLDEIQGEQWNLRLSQDRSMEVVKQSLQSLEATPDLRRFFLDKVSANGRGESQPAVPDRPNAEENRRVVFKIRIKPDSSENMNAAFEHQGLKKAEGVS